MNKCDVKLISKTIAVIDDMTLSGDEYIAYCARVSNPENQHNHGTSAKLLRYLIKHNHWSPFEMAHLTMEINTTRDIARQILRHRSFTFQEFSQRYAKVENTCLMREARLQDNKNRQNSIDCGDSSELTKWWEDVQDHITGQTLIAYNQALERGIAKEVARSLLPEGLTPSKLYMSGSARSWYHYTQLRMGNGTQKEHKLIAEQCFNILTTIHPCFLVEDKNGYTV